MTRALVAVVTLPLWLPVLLAAASASLVLGILITVGGIVLRNGHADDNWDEHIPTLPDVD